MPENPDRQPLLQAIAAQESLRGTLPDAVIEATLAALRKQLDELDAAAATAEQQRKHVTVLFADAAGFTAMSELLDAELVAERMNTVWRALDAVIVEHGGHIDKHIGDAVMALWGAETAREDDPERAIRAALGMQAALAALPECDPLAIRVGLHTGPVLLGRVGSTHEFTAMGDTVNVASRLEELAPPGGVVISQTTYSQVRGVFDVDERPAVAVRGKAEPVAVYEVLRAKPRAFRMSTRGVEGVTTRMIGREPELARLKEIYLDVLETAEPRAVTVIGEAGVGKSRLMREFEDWIELRPESVLYYQGRANPALQTTPYSLFRDLFAFRFGIRESDSRVVALTKFREGIAAGWGEAAPPLTADQADVLGQWLGFDFSPSTAVTHLLGSQEFGLIAQSYLIRYFTALAAARPLAILLEDIHWADDPSLDLIARLGQTIDRGQLLLIANARPTLLERRPHWGEGEANRRQLVIEPLSRRAERELVEEILQRVDEIPTALRDTIVDAAEGNPFYTEELVKMLIEQGVIDYEDPHQPWRVHADRLAEVRVPETLTGLLQARLDALPRPEQEVLQRAAVVGRLFWDGAVADLSQATTTEIHPLLQASRRRELIFQREHSAFEGNLELIFKHSLLRDVAYERVLLRHRQALHGRAARWLEANAGERRSEYLSQIADHYRQAGENDIAAQFLLWAGRDAYESSAFTAARLALEEAVALKSAAPDDDRELVETLVLLSEIALRQVDLPETQRLAERGLAGARLLGDKALQAEALATLTEVAQQRGEHEQARRLAQEEALPLAREVGGATLARTLLALSLALRNLGELDEAGLCAAEALEVARATGHSSLQARAMIVGVNNEQLRGNIDQAMKAHVESLTFARTTGNLFSEALALVNMGDNAYELGDFAAARSYGLEGLELMQSLGMRQRSLPLINIAQAELMLGEYAAARHNVAEALRLLHGRERDLEWLFALQVWAEILAAEGNREQALAILCLVYEQPSYDYEGQQEIEAILARLGVSDEERTVAKTAAADLDLEALSRDILSREILSAHAVQP